MVVNLYNPSKDADGLYTGLGINENGLLSVMRFKYEMPEKEMAFYNMYLSNSDVGLYTRFRYYDEGHVYNFSSGDNSFDCLVPKKENGEWNTTINGGVQTKLIESVKVVFGNSGYVKISSTYNNTERSGKIGMIE